MPRSWSSSARTALARSFSRWAGPALVTVLVLASIAALIVNQRIRRDGLVIDAIHLTQSFRPGEMPRGATITFRIKGPDEIDLDVIGPDGGPVRRIATAQTLADREPTFFHWDGSTQDGAVAPPGTYTLRVHEYRRDRTITPGEEMVLLAPGQVPPADEEIEGTAP